MELRRLALLALLVAVPSRAWAQDRDDERGIVGLVTNFISSLSDKARDGAFQFLETIELFDVEAEIDRFVGNPWELSDSTAYKLSLLPLHIGYPTYQQLARQMTRLDDLRSRRIQNVTPDSVEVIALRLDSLSRRIEDQVSVASVVTHFNVREIVDLGVFALSHQPFFPETEEGWRYYKRKIADHGPELAAGAVALGAAFEAGAFAQSGTIKKWADDRRVGWYGGFRRLGFQFRPLLRGGLTARMLGFELSGGVAEKIRPEEDDRRRALELAFREGWLSRLVRPSGWDVFVEGALRGVLAHEARYDGEVTTGRAGLFIKREAPSAQLRFMVLRSSAEVESDFDHEMRFAIGLGFEHTRTGLAAVLQSSRTAIVRDGVRFPENRGGLFFAGTMEPPTEFFVDAMQLRARLVRDEWDALAEIERQLAGARLTHVAAAGLPSPQRLASLEALGRDTAAVESHVARLAELLPEYLESRRFAYSISRWQRAPNDLHGPLDGGVLSEARSMVLARLYGLARFLEDAPRTLAPIHRRFSQVREVLERLGPTPSDPLAAGYRAELEDLDRNWRRESERVSAGLRAYEHYRESARRIAAAASRLAPARDPNPLSPPTMRKLLVLTAPPLP